MPASRPIRTPLERLNQLGPVCPSRPLEPTAVTLLTRVAAVELDNDPKSRRN